MKMITHSHGAKILTLCTAFVLVMIPDMAPAQDVPAVTAVLVNISGFLTGPFGKAAAGLAVIVLGFLTLSGNIQLRTAVTILGGIILIFLSGALIRAFLPAAT